LNDSDLLNGLGFDVAHAVDVLEPKFELRDHQPFHLLRIHAAKIDEHENLRLIDRRKDVDTHAIESQRPAAH